MAVACTRTLDTDTRITRNSLTVSLAHTQEHVEQCLRLRYRVFANELGASVSSDNGMDRDGFDRYCKHLAVVDHKTGQTVATTRLLLDHDAAAAGGFYSETEFDLNPVLRLPGKKLEVGRTCIHPQYRKGAALALLWHGLARIVDVNDVDYLIGCASIPMASGGPYVNAVVEELRAHHFSAPQLRVRPRTPLPTTDGIAIPGAGMPTLLKGYLRQGAVVCGEPHWDAAFNVADVFVLLDRERLAQRYVRRFLSR